MQQTPLSFFKQNERFLMLSGDLMAKKNRFTFADF